MILPFSTQLNGKPTYFVEKILKGLAENNLITPEELSYRMCPAPVVKYPTAYGFIFDMTIDIKSKLHTIREDKNDRWKPGTKIDFFINCRQKNMFRFAPVLPVVSVQKVEIVYYHNRETLTLDLPQKRGVIVDDKPLMRSEIEQLALNDGFDTIENFFAYFNEDFTGKIIHWTVLRY